MRRKAIKRWAPLLAIGGAVVVGGVAAVIVARGQKVGTTPITIGNLRAHAKPNDRAAPHVSERDAGDVYAAVLHQMSFSRGNDPMRYLGVTAHYIVLPDGSIWQLYDHSVRLPAANGFNAGSVSIEFAGNHPNRSLSEDPSDWWYPKDRKNDPALRQHLTQEQAAAGRALMAHLQANGIRMVLAHRQSDDQRGNDPGPDIWGAVGEFAVRDLGMDHDPDETVGDGKPIPQHWKDAYGAWNGAVAA